jgi:hypothetical protein
VHKGLGGGGVIGKRERKTGGSRERKEGRKEGRNRTEEESEGEDIKGRYKGISWQVGGEHRVQMTAL